MARELVAMESGWLSKYSRPRPNSDVRPCNESKKKNLNNSTATEQEAQQEMCYSFI